MGIEWFQKKTQGAGHGVPARGVLLSKNMQNHGDGRKSTPCLSIRLAKDVMKECRLVAGDLVEVGMDKQNGQLVMRRVLQNGYKLVATCTGNRKCSDMVGSCVASMIRIPAIEWLPTVFPNGVARYQAEYAADEHGLLIQLAAKTKA